MGRSSSYRKFYLEGFYHFTFDVLFDGQIVQLGLRDILIRRIEEEFEDSGTGLLGSLTK
jgi:hypothetical protein